MMKLKKISYKGLVCKVRYNGRICERCIKIGNNGMHVRTCERAKHMRKREEGVG